MRQKQDESVQVYAERLLRISDEAFVDYAPVEKQLIGYFTDGLRSDKLKMRILRESPPTLQAAVRIAMKEQNIYKTFNLRYHSDPSDRVEEPMEIGRGRKKFWRPRIKQQRVNAYQAGGRSQTYSYSRQQASRYQNRSAPRSDIICYECQLPGHIARECPQGKVRSRQRTSYRATEDNSSQTVTPLMQQEN